MFTANLDALANRVSELQSDLDAILALVTAHQLELDALINGEQVKSLFIDGYLQQLDKEKQAFLDSYLAFAIEHTATIDAYLRISSYAPADVDALISRLGAEKTVSLDASLFVGYISQLALDSIVYQSIGKTLDVDACINGRLDKTYLIDAILYATLSILRPRFVLFSNLTKDYLIGTCTRAVFHSMLNKPSDEGLKSNWRIPEFHSTLGEGQGVN